MVTKTAKEAKTSLKKLAKITSHVIMVSLGVNGQDSAFLLSNCVMEKKIVMIKATSLAAMKLPLEILRVLALLDNLSAMEAFAFQLRRYVMVNWNAWMEPMKTVVAILFPR